MQLVVAARAVLCRDGVAGTTLRAVAAEAGVPLGTLHYVFPSKERLITAVVEDIRDEVSAVFQSAEVDAGLEHAIRHGVENYWQQLVVGQPELALMRHEVFVYALRTPVWTGWPDGRSRATPGSWPSGAKTPQASPERPATCRSTCSAGSSSAVSSAWSFTTWATATRTAHTETSRPPPRCWSVWPTLTRLRTLSIAERSLR